MSAALANLRVVDFSKFLPGPYCSWMLADLGAQVVRIENPRELAKQARVFGWDKLSVEQRAALRASDVFARNKRSVLIDPGAAEARQVIIDLVRNADGVFLAGGDQANYVRYWKGTPLAEALGNHVRAGKPIAGTSAGLAVLGGHVYGALDGGSQTSSDALADPAGPQSTLVGDFLRLPFLTHVITDSHFDQRARQGRLISWIARLVHESDRTDITGVGVDEYTALAIAGDGRARVFSGNGGHVWLFRPLRAADIYAAGKPLSFRDVPAIGLGTDSVLHLPQFRVERPAFEVVYDVDAGRITKRPKP